MNIGKSNATSFKKGHARIPGAGRKPGTPNRTTQQLKDAILEAADRLGYIREEPKLDDKGKPTGEIELVHDGKDATVGYLMWLGKHNPASFAALLARVLPIQLNQKQEQKQKAPVRYETYEEVKAALIAKGWSPDMLAAVERSMEPKFIQEERKKEELRAALRERGIDPDILEAAPDVIAAMGLKFLEDKKPDPVQ
jgi:hypothetical protein